MNYSDDAAMDRFTEQQSNRMVCGLLNYRANTFATSSDTTFSVTGGSSPLAITGLTNGTPYSCSVVATNSSGSSAASTAVVAIPKIPTAPGIPTISQTDYGDGEIYLYVTVADNGGSAITGYTATCSDGVSSYAGSSAGSPVTVAGLVNGTAYSCSVTVTNAIGTSASSAPTGSITPEEGIGGGLPVWLLYQATQ
jgi:titin